MRQVTFRGMRSPQSFNSASKLPLQQTTDAGLALLRLRGATGCCWAAGLQSDRPAPPGACYSREGWEDLNIRLPERTAAETYDGDQYSGVQSARTSIPPLPPRQIVKWEGETTGRSRTPRAGGEGLETGQARHNGLASSMGPLKNRSALDVFRNFFQLGCLF